MWNWQDDPGVPIYEQVIRQVNRLLLACVGVVVLWTLALFTGGLGSIGKVSLEVRWPIAGLLWLFIVVVGRWFSTDGRRVFLLCPTGGVEAV